MSFLADHATMLRPSVCCLSSVVCDVCIVAKQCVLDQKLLLTAYRKWYIMRNRLVPKWMTMSTIALHSPLNISKTVTDRGLVPKYHR